MTVGNFEHVLTLIKDKLSKKGQKYEKKYSFRAKIKYNSTVHGSRLQYDINSLPLQTSELHCCLHGEGDMPGSI